MNTVEQPRKRVAVLGRFAALPLVLGCCAVREEIGLLCCCWRGRRWAWTVCGKVELKCTALGLGDAQGGGTG